MEKASHAAIPEFCKSIVKLDDAAGWCSFGEKRCSDGMLFSSFANQKAKKGKEGY